MPLSTSQKQPTEPKKRLPTGRRAAAQDRHYPATPLRRAVASHRRCPPAVWGIHQARLRRAGGAVGQQLIGNTACLGFTSVLVRKGTKKHKSWATTRSPRNLEKKESASCVRGVGKLRFGLVPESKLSDAQGWGCSVRETWASLVSSFSRLAQKQQ